MIFVDFRQKRTLFSDNCVRLLEALFRKKTQVILLLPGIFNPSMSIKIRGELPQYENSMRCGILRTKFTVLPATVL